MGWIWFVITWAVTSLVAYFFVPMWVTLTLGITVVIVAIPLSWWYHRTVPGAFSIFNKEAKYEHRLWLAVSKDRADMAPHLVMQKIMERHRCRTGCFGEACSHRRRLPLSPRWVLVWWLLGGDLYCDVCGDRVAENRFSGGS